MKNKPLFQRPVSWIVFVLIAALCAVYTYYNFDEANSLVNVEIEMDREAALDLASKLAQEFDLGPAEFYQAAGFDNDAEFQIFIELEGGGLDTFTLIMEKGYYHPYQWRVRHFQEHDANEVTFRFKPNGELYGFVEKIPESREGASLSQEEAQDIAEETAESKWQTNLSAYSLVEKSIKEQINGRIDHTFVYERDNDILEKGEFRLRLVVSGDKLTALDYHFKVPEDFNRRYSEMRSANETISTVASAVMVLIYGIIGVLVTVFVLMRTRRLIWKPALYWGLGITFASVFLVSINHLPFEWFSYDTSVTRSNFLSRTLLQSFLGAVVFGGVMALSFMAAEGLGRMSFGKHIQWWKIWSPNSRGSIPVLGQTIAGYLFAAVILGFDILFYVTTKNNFGWWSPAGTLSDPNILATYLPWFDSIAISLQAGFWEEALFRAVPIAGIFILTKGKRSRILWIVVVLLVQTLVFGAGHANYPQQPSYARVIEMIIPFTIMGVIYIYYGILPAVVAHYAVDVFWFSLPLWVSSASGIWTDRILVILFLLLPVFIVLIARVIKGKWSQVPDEERNAGWQIPDKTEVIEQKIEKVEIKAIPGMEKWLIAVGIAGLALWYFFTPFKTDAPELDLSRREAIEVASSQLEAEFEINPDEWRFLTSVADAVDIRDIFVWREGGKDAYQKMLDQFLAPPSWTVRLVKTEGKAEEKTEEYIARIGSDGNVFGLRHKFPEAAEGARLELEIAQAIADSVLLARHSLVRTNLKEVSVKPTKQENRTDWEFIYADTVNYTLAIGQGRYVVNIAGSEVANSNPFVHVPEDWGREYNESSSKKSIIRNTGNILLVLTVILGLVLAIIRWTRKKFNLKVFLVATLFFACFVGLEMIFNWPSAIAGYDTQIPFGSFKLTLLIGMTLSGLFIVLIQSIIAGALPGWISVGRAAASKSNLLNAVFLGIGIAGILAVADAIAPKTTPTWPSLDFLNSGTPWIAVALNGISGFVFYPAFAFVLFLGMQHFTNGWQSRKWAGIGIAVLAGLALTASGYENLTAWLLPALTIALVVVGMYYFFIRFHFEWIPVTFGILAIISTLEQVITLGSAEIIVGGIVAILITAGFLLWWYNEVVKAKPEE